MDHAADPAELLEDPGFLVYARPDRYLASLGDACPAVGRGREPSGPDSGQTDGDGTGGG